MPTSTRLLAVSYVRVSTREQTDRDGDPDGYSIPAQLEANRRKAEALGAHIIEEFIDRGESARSADRPELQRMLVYVSQHPISYCIVHKVDRLARNRVDDVAINLALNTADVRLISATENIDETPSGMLLHGIMSSIAEFYSRNLANEVMKGMQQKAKTGGTPGKAPIGYRNAGVISTEGREVRTVIVDNERADLIRWAFSAYATGEWTLRQLTKELSERGLMSRATPSRPGKVITVTQLQKILSNPYYKGEVRFGGASFPGRHEPLVDPVVWQRVQDVMASHVVGEKVRQNHHYLKSSLYCDCGSRMLVQHSVNRHGTLYEYFVCSGRHEKRNGCMRSAVSIGLIESKVVDLYRGIQIEADLRAEVELHIKRELEASSEDARRKQRELLQEQTRLQARSKKLLDSHLDGAVPASLYREEQERISRQLSSIANRLSSTAVTFTTIERHLKESLDLIENCFEAYRRAPDDIRRRFNQAFFERIVIEQDFEVVAELAEPFRSLQEATQDLARLEGAKTRPRELRRRDENGMDSALGSRDEHLVPLEGLEPPTLSLGRNCSSIELQRLTRRV
jgi:site-specific DNA recombinase